MTRPASSALAVALALSLSGCFYPATRGRVLEDRVDRLTAENERMSAELAQARTQLATTLPRIDEKVAEVVSLAGGDVACVLLEPAMTNIGIVLPDDGYLAAVREVCDLAHQVGARVLLDARQSIGQLPIDVADLDVDALSATGRKWLRGPRGTGFLYARPDADLDPAVLDLHGAEWSSADGFTVKTDATRFELWEHDVAARLGLGAAARYLLDIGQDVVRSEIAARADYLREALAPVARVHDLGIEHSGIVSFTVDGLAPVDVRDRLARDDITVTVSHRSSTLLDMSRRKLAAVVRASPHYFVSRADLDRFVTAVAGLRD